MTGAHSAVASAYSANIPDWGSSAHDLTLAHFDRASSGPDRVVCRCLQVTQEIVLAAVAALELRTIKEIRQHTGAGDGCTACHKNLQKYLERK